MMQLHQKLTDIQHQLRLGLMSDVIQRQWQTVLEKYTRFCSTYWKNKLRQRAKKKFLKEGDENHAYSHAVIKQKRSQNFIHKVVDINSFIRDS